MRTFHVFVSALAIASGSAGSHAQVAIKAKKVYTMRPDGAGFAAPIENGVVVIEGGKVKAVGPAASTTIPAGFRTIEGAVATPGLIDARSTVGLSGIYNQAHDSDQLERSSPLQPELRALDAYNPQERLIAYVRSFGVTAINTGNAPGELISGQTMLVKTTGKTVEDALVKDATAVVATIGPAAQKGSGGPSPTGGGDEGRGKSPGTRGKMMSMLREEFIKAQEYAAKVERAGADKKPERNIRHETLGRALRGEIPVMISADRAQDLDSCLRLASEFGFKLILNSAAESYLMLDRIKAAGVPVVLHASMARAVGDSENQSFETASALRTAGIPFAIESGYEGYVPKARIVLLEAAVAAANGLTFEDALAAITIRPAQILGVADRLGSLEAGKDGDVALYDGDPFEYTTHCVGVVINGVVVSDTPR